MQNLQSQLTGGACGGFGTLSPSDPILVPIRPSRVLGGGPPAPALPEPASPTYVRTKLADLADGSGAADSDVRDALSSMNVDELRAVIDVVKDGTLTDACGPQLTDSVQRQISAVFAEKNLTYGYDPIIQAEQKAFADAGLYSGPLDGVLNSEIADVEAKFADDYDVDPQSPEFWRALVLLLRYRGNSEASVKTLIDGVPSSILITVASANREANEAVGRGQTSFGSFIVADPYVDEFYEGG